MRRLTPAAVIGLGVLALCVLCVLCDVLDGEAQEVQVPRTVPYDRLSTWERIVLLMDLDRKINNTLAVIDYWGPPRRLQKDPDPQPDPNE